MIGEHKMGDRANPRKRATNGTESSQGEKTGILVCRDERGLEMRHHNRQGKRSQSQLEVALKKQEPPPNVRCWLVEWDR